MNAVVSAASIAPAVAIASPSPVKQDADEELRHLWRRYRNFAEKVSAARETHRPSRLEADAKIDNLLSAPKVPWEDWNAAMQEIHAEPEFRRTWDAVNKACDNTGAVIRAIHNTKASSLLGVAIKLSSLPHYNFEVEDMKDAAISVLRDIDDLLGTDFALPYAEHYTDALATWGLSDEADA